jgi:hypothetical protein
MQSKATNEGRENWRMDLRMQHKRCTMELKTVMGMLPARDQGEQQPVLISKRNPYAYLKKHLLSRSRRIGWRRKK